MTERQKKAKKAWLTRSLNDYEKARKESLKKELMILKRIFTKLLAPKEN
jgi:hypothetical protein